MGPPFHFKTKGVNKEMKNRDAKNIARAVIKAMAMTGTGLYMRNLMPYTNPVGTACCITTTAVVALAMSDVIDKQITKAEMIIEGLANGDQMVVF